MGGAAWADSMLAVSLEIDEVPGSRWEIALQLLEDGGGLVVVPGEVPVGLQRWVGWPQADGKVMCVSRVSSPTVKAPLAKVRVAIWPPSVRPDTAMSLAAMPLSWVTPNGLDARWAGELDEDLNRFCNDGDPAILTALYERRNATKLGTRPRPVEASCPP